MSPFDDTKNPFDEFQSEADKTPARKVKVEEILTDLRAGLRTKGFLEKYDLTIGEFERLLKKLIRKGLFTKEEFIAWKAHRKPDAVSVEPYFGDSDAPAMGENGSRQGVMTYVIKDPESNDSWALQLFSTQRDLMHGAAFKVDLQGKRYSFIVEQMLFRGSVNMLPGVGRTRTATKEKREEAIEYISEHGWAAYLESRAIDANLNESGLEQPKKARLVLLHCRNNTFLAALHTPAPAINLYVGSSLDNIKRRLAKSVDTSALDI